MVKVSTPVLALPSTATPFASTSTKSSVSNSEGDSNLLDFKRSDLGLRRSELESIALDVIDELEVEGDMVTDYRVGFKERRRKLLFETIEVAALPTKRTCPEEVQEEPMKDAPPTPVPTPDAAGSSGVPTTRKERLRMGHLAVLLLSRRIWIRRMSMLSFLLPIGRK